VGRAGTTIIDDLAELDEFDHEPWTSGQVSGQIVFEALQQTAGRRAVLRDRDAFPVFRDAVESIEDVVSRTVERVRVEVDTQTADRLSDTVRRIFQRVLKELADLDNPMRTLLGDVPGDEGLLRAAPGDPVPKPQGRRPEPTLEDLEPRAPVADRRDEPPHPTNSGSGGTRTRHLPSLAPDPDPGHSRSRFDADAGIVLYNDRHADYLLVKDNEASLLDYLATLVAKEYVVYNNPRATSEDLAEEMVRMLVRVRRHLPRRK
jgi:hypothetical protein